MPGLPGAGRAYCGGKGKGQYLSRCAVDLKHQHKCHSRAAARTAYPTERLAVNGFASPRAAKALAAAGWIQRAAHSGASSGVKPAATQPETDPGSKPRSRHSIASSTSRHVRMNSAASAGVAPASIHGVAVSGSPNPPLTHLFATATETPASRHFSDASAVKPRRHHG